MSSINKMPADGGGGIEQCGGWKVFFPRHFSSSPTTNTLTALTLCSKEGGRQCLFFLLPPPLSARLRRERGTEGAKEIFCPRTVFCQQ